MRTSSLQRAVNGEMPQESRLDQITPEQQPERIMQLDADVVFTLQKNGLLDPVRAEFFYRF